MRRLFDWWRRAWSLRATQRELHGLSDRMLRDIGLRREQIQSFFRR